MKNTLEKLDRLHQYLKGKTEFTKSSDSHTNEMLSLSTTSTLAFFKAMFWEEISEIEAMKQESN